MHPPDDTILPSPEKPLPAARPPLWRRYLPLGLLVTGFGLFYLLGGADLISLSSLKHYKDDLQAFTDSAPLLTVTLFSLAYILVVAFSLPGGAIMTILGGFLFGTFWGGTVVVFAATIGATIIFLAARTAFHDVLARKAGPWLKRLEKGFQDGAISYLLVLRLVPLFPFFIVNLAPAFFAVPLRIYVLTTLVGIIPGSFVYASVGNGLDALLAAGEDPNLGLIFEPAIFLPLLGLSLLALLPIAYKTFKSSRGENK